MLGLRIVLVLGLALITFALGAAGWHYWQETRGPAPAEAAQGAHPTGPLAGMVFGPPPASDPDLGTAPAQDWLISPGGGLAPRDLVAAVLDQDRFVTPRTVSITTRQPLARMLSAGEALPGAAYLDAFAAIRAPVLALDLCGPLLEGPASGCRLTGAEALAESLDAADGSAAFRFRAEFTEEVAGRPLPALDAHVVEIETFVAEVEAVGGSQPWAPPDVTARSLARTAAMLCREEEKKGHGCRLVSLAMDWQAPKQGRMTIRYARLVPLPPGMYPAPPLD
ncbi:hypothetical protein [Pseudogemmobacter sonorensis]|uniref:hypothetical protein n=1 Tax=Pseudogemmobacter sonorensis TaxID=2989681 RepID=UPI0036B79AED